MAPNQIRPEHLADAMGISVDRLWALARHVDACYKPRRMQWDGRKHRPIDPLENGPKKLLRRLHAFFQRNHLSHPSAHGGIQGKSCFTSARVHVGRRFVWTRDAADCYPSISPKALRHELRHLGFCNDTASILTLLFTYRGGIPQGSPISGDALNIFFWRLDHQMASMSGHRSLRYSRVADDFVISGKNAEAGNVVVAKLEAELQDRGILVNQKKKREKGLQGCSDERLVHSISVSKPRGTGISRRHMKAVLALSDQYVAACRSVDPESIQAVAAKRATITGWMYYCRQADYGPARTIRQRLEAGDRHVLRKLCQAKISSKGNKWWVVDYKRHRNEPKRIATAWQKRKERLVRASTCIPQESVAT